MNPTPEQVAKSSPDGFPLDIDEPCAHCGQPHGAHRVISDQCPFGAEYPDITCRLWKETTFKETDRPAKGAK